MIPSGTINEIVVDDAKQPSRTYKINADRNVISGYVDALESVRQAVVLILATERYNYPVYSWNYGVELENLIGKDIVFVSAETKRRIKEALTQDDRVSEVVNFKFTRHDDELLVEFEVVTDYGNFNTETVVNI